MRRIRRKRLTRRSLAALPQNGSLTLESKTVWRIIFFLLLAFLSLACSRKSATAEPERHYHLSGEVLALDPKTQSATINAATIPNFMEAMTMDYPIKSKREFDTLHVGDKIEATVNVSASGVEYNLSGIQKQSSGKQR